MAVANRDSDFARWVNLLVPGGGLICLGNLAGGLVLGLLFIVTANLAIVASLIIPDDFSPAGRNLAILSAAIVYLSAQFVLAQTLRRRTRRDSTVLRRQCLGRARRSLDEGDARAAIRELEQLGEARETDLTIAVQWAQVVEAGEDATAAREAWGRVVRLDRHHLYRAETRAAMARLAADPLGTPPVEEAPSRAD